MRDVSVGEITGISAALARIGEIRSLVGAGVNGAGAVPATPSVPGGFAQALAAASGAGPVTDVASGAGPFAAVGPPGVGPFAGVGTGGPLAPAGAASAISSLPGATEMANQIDEWIARKNPDSPLRGYGAVFVREGLANGIDPRALAAIARAESGLGSDPGARSIHNAFGWGPHRPFSSWEENIATVAAGLKKGYLDEGLVTLAQIQQKYCPVGAANDPSGLNSNWLPNTTVLYAELGGNPNGSVAIAPGAAAV